MINAASASVTTLERQKLSTAAILACLVAAVSAIPALLVASSFQQPAVNNYYQTTTNITSVTNTTNNYNTTTGTINKFDILVPHFMNVTAELNQSRRFICNVPLVNKTSRYQSRYQSRSE